LHESPSDRKDIQIVSITETKERCCPQNNTKTKSTHGNLLINYRIGLIFSANNKLKKHFNRLLPRVKIKPSVWRGVLEKSKKFWLNIFFPNQ